MFWALFTGASGMIAQQLSLDNVGNKVANTGTAGFRRRRLQFQDFLYQNLVAPGPAATKQTTVPSGLQVGLGSRPSSSEIIQEHGDYAITDNPYDLTIQGRGFFQVALPTGETTFTRGGTFHLDQQGNIVTADGNPLQPTINIPPNALSVSAGSAGTVSVSVPGQTAAQQMGAIQLAKFPNPGGLDSLGKNLFLATAASAAPLCTNSSVCATFSPSTSLSRTRS
jgi:flagellar basal-body rod protein FlgG